MHLAIKVIPRSKKSEIVGRMADGTLKIRLKAIPENGEANAELQRFLADALDLSKEDIQIVSGFTDPRKLVKLPDLTLPW